MYRSSGKIIRTLTHSITTKEAWLRAPPERHAARTRQGFLFFMFEQFFLSLALIGCLGLVYRLLAPRRVGTCQRRPGAGPEPAPLVQITKEPRR
jgi:hypothetical protein